MNVISARVIKQLAPNGVLHAGINLANPLLVTGKDANGAPVGLSPDIAAAIASALGVPCKLVGFERPGQTADAVNNCGVVMIAAEKERAKTIAFSPPYVEIEATYLVPAGSPIKDISDVDRPGVRIAVSERTAYDLYLTDHLTQAKLIRIDGLDAAFQYFKSEKLDALAGLRPAMIAQADSLPGSRILDGQFTTALQSIGTAKENVDAVLFLHDFIEEAKRNGTVRDIIAKHRVKGLTVGRASI